MLCCIYILRYVNKEPLTYSGSMDVLIVLVNITTKTLENFGDKEIAFSVRLIPHRWSCARDVRYRVLIYTELSTLIPCSVLVSIRFSIICAMPPSP